MRTRAVVGLLILMFTAWAAGARGAEHTWDVYTAGELDERIERQLNVLAVQDQALIHFLKTTAQTSRVVPAAGGLVIELRQESNVAAFLDALNREAGATAISPTVELAREGYIIEANYPRAAVPNRLRITAATWRGFHHALLRVPDLLAIWPANLSNQLIPHPQAVRIEENGISAVIVDFPSFPERGVVEGFYGIPWTHQDRVDILRFEGAHGMNVYYYAPKDDPYPRKLWRDAYPPEAQQRLGELARAAQHNFVDFCFAISPGLTMAYSSERDFQVLTNKLASVGKLGVSCFALFLDDVPQDLQDPQDRAQFKSLAQAHVYLTNKLYKHLKEQSAANRLTLTPTTYTNEWGNRDYLRELGAGVDRGVSMVWTGPKVFSPAITTDQAREWGGHIHRPPLIWDNYPVNDGTRWCRYLGPLTGRDAHLPTVARGLVSNPMNEAHASMIPLQTIADYLWNAAAYDPEQSETHAVVSQYGEEAPRQLAPFLKIYGTYNWDDGTFTALFKERRQPMDVAKMQSQLAEMNSALERLRNQRRLEPLLNEISPAIKRTSERLAEVNADPAFRHLPDGTIQWDENYEALSAYRLAQSPNLDGDFSKWERGPMYRLDDRAPVMAGAKLWRGLHDLSARMALAWDANFLYVGVDVIDPDLYQPFFARGIQNGDTFVLTLEAGFRKNFLATEPTGDEYTLYFSPGNFAGVKPSIFSDEDYLPPRPQSHNYMQEIYTAWKKTANGYSGDIAVPVTFFEGGKLAQGYELGLGFSVMKVIPPTKPTDAEDLERVVLQSKKDRLFRVTAKTPSSFPRLVLTEGKP
ncbi:MAG TPA: beta-N-acetylglucosaminidase domain-containing protein [Terriglobia bacterium]|nr:beta-N-acetylglucosaminidase domain-containing protein [Terriglobia bacterium]